MQHRRPVRYRLDHGGQLLGMVVLAVCIRTRWVIYTHMYCSIVIGVYPGVPRYTPKWNNGG